MTGPKIMITMDTLRRLVAAAWTLGHAGKDPELRVELLDEGAVKIHLSAKPVATAEQGAPAELG